MKQSRTKREPRYKKVNDAGAKRQAFRNKLILAWVKQNHPEVIEAIYERSYQEFPVPGRVRMVKGKLLETLNEIGLNGTK